MRKKKNIIFAVALLGMSVLIGGTAAYHQSTGFFRNIFKVGYWKNETTEEFTGPDNWQPCQEIPKTVIGKNTGSVPASVRIKYEEYWKNVGNTDLSHTSDLSLTDNDGDRIAYVKLQNQDDWVDGGDGWYYYKYMLGAGSETSSLLKSVVLDCKNNFAGENTCVAENGQTVCTKPENPYDGAKYHVFVTVQYTSEPSEWDYVPEKDRRLYDLVASKTIGTDEAVTFYESDINESNSGVYTLKAHANDEHPVYYYRGSVKNNYVIVGNICWLLMRTTGTGGTKIIYAGEQNNGVCSEDTNSITRTAIPADARLYSDLGYYYATYWDARSRMDFTSNQYMFSDYRVETFASEYGNDITVGGGYSWDDSSKKYTLTDTITHRVSTGGNNLDELATHQYFFPDASDESKIGYIISANYTYIYYIPMKNGETVGYMKDNFYNYKYDSNAKKYVDEWYEREMANQTDKLEDTVFCNERETMDGSIDDLVFSKALSSRYNTTSADTIALRRNFDSVQRENGVYGYSPSVDCSGKKYAFTVNESSSGNGKLRYPVGLATVDEVRMAGANSWIKSSFSENGTWTMSAAKLYADGAMMCYWFNTLSCGYQVRNDWRTSLRPVVSLKYDTYVSGGNGTSSSPYRLHW